jgi:hypothetical protein
MPRWTGLVLLGALVLHALLEKLPAGRLPEMLFDCHVASVLLAMGLLARRRELVAVGFMFHAGVGFWGWFIDLVATMHTSFTSVLVHLLPLGLGYAELRRTGGLPRFAPYGAFALFAVMLVVSYVATPPALNVNHAHHAWEPVAPYLPGLWATWLYDMAVCAIFLLATTPLLRKVLPHG